jgi:hypothetical protein
MSGVAEPAAGSACGHATSSAGSGLPRNNLDTSRCMNQSIEYGQPVAPGANTTAAMKRF